MPRKKEKELNEKTFNVRMTRENWLFLKHISAIRETSMSEVVTNCINNYKKSLGMVNNVENCITNSLTNSDIVI